MRERSRLAKAPDAKAAKLPLTSRRSEEENPAIAELTRLQQTIGNRATAELLSIGQAKLKVGRAADASELEADAIAAEVVAHLGGSVENHAPLARREEPKIVVRKPRDVAAATPEVGLEGGTLSEETEHTIADARQGGTPLASPVRREMETAFGADFSAVRVHADERASRLNDTVQAKAFTVGNDIFFRGGMPDVSSESGQKLLAHELTHTIQQGSSSEVGRTPAIQRLAFTDTQWGQADSARVSSAGSMGVLIMDDGRGKLVVKAGEAFGSEALVAGKLLGATTGGNGGGQWSGGAPDARPVEPAEAHRISARAQILLPDGEREGNFLAELAKGTGVIVYGFAEGKDMQKLLGEQKQTKKGAFGKRTLRKDSVMYALLNDPGLMTVFGQTVATDLFMGNTDRVIGPMGESNLENFLIDMQSKKVSLVDNISLDVASQLHDLDTETTAKIGMQFWMGKPVIKKLLDGNYGELASQAVDEMGQAIYGGGTSLREEDLELVQKSYDKRKEALAAWALQGITDAVQVIGQQLHNVRGLVSTVDKDSRQLAATVLIARRLVLENHLDLNTAWDQAEEEAQRLYAPPTNTNGERGQQGPGWQRAEPRGRVRSRT